MAIAELTEISIFQEENGGNKYCILTKGGYKANRMIVEKKLVDEKTKLKK